MIERHSYLQVGRVAPRRMPVAHSRNRSDAAAVDRETCSCAALSVLRSSIAIVIGPTPPGTGVMQPGDARATASKSTSPHEPVVGAVHADVDHRGARLDPVGADQPRHADGGDQHVGARADRRQVARARVADRDRRVALQQQVRDRLADEVRAADDDRLGALERDAVRGRAARSRRSACTAAGPACPAASRPALIGVSPSTSLSGSIRRGQRGAVEVVGQRAAGAGSR